MHRSHTGLFVEPLRKPPDIGPLVVGSQPANDRQSCMKFVTNISRAGRRRRRQVLKQRTVRALATLAFPAVGPNAVT